MPSWIPVADDSDFSLFNLPYGVFSNIEAVPRIGVAIGDYVLDLKSLASEHVFDDLDFDVTTLKDKTLNAFAALGREVTSRVRRRLQQLLEKETNFASLLRDNPDRRKECLLPLDSITMHLPVAVSDYTDFFIGLYHAQNVSYIYRSIMEKSARLTECDI
jgi:fumarylacetoacetase